MLDTAQLEGQQELLMARFRENKELMDEVKGGMTENLRLAKQNIDILKNKGGSVQVKEISSDKNPASLKAPPAGPPPKAAAKGQ